MARGRMLNKSISYNLAVAKLIDEVGPYGGLIFTWMIAHLDAEGRIQGDPDVLKGIVCPRLAGITPAIIRQTAGKAHELGLLVVYEADGDIYIFFPGFARNQPNMRKNREPKSLIPAPPCDAAGTLPETFRQIAGRVTADCRQSDGRLPDDCRLKRREEKRREEKLSNTSAPSSESSPPESKSLQLSSTSLTTSVKEPAVWIPLNDGTEFGVPYEQVADWCVSYPALDVLQQLRSAREWCLANPKNRKTKSGVVRFLVGWLARAQNAAPRTGQQAKFETFADKAMKQSIEFARKHGDSERPF